MRTGFGSDFFFTILEVLIRNKVKRNIFNYVKVGTGYVVFDSWGKIIKRILIPRSEDPKKIPAQLKKKIWIRIRPLFKIKKNNIYILGR